jgi:hypothetical protein
MPTLAEFRAIIDNCRHVANHATRQIATVACLHPAADQWQDCINAQTAIIECAMADRATLVALAHHYKAERGQG